jgi:hypothetical protein
MASSQSSKVQSSDDGNEMPDSFLHMCFVHGEEEALLMSGAPDSQIFLTMCPACCSDAARAKAIRDVL